MAMIRYAHIRRILLLLLLLFVWSVMLLPGAGEWYALTIYPSLSKGLSAISSLFPSFPLFARRPVYLRDAAVVRGRYDKDQYA